VKYAIYSINGSLVAFNSMDNNEFSIRLNKGSFVIDILTKSGRSVKKKVFIF